MSPANCACEWRADLVQYASLLHPTRYAKRTLRELWQQPGRQDAEEPLKAWHQQAKAADWDGQAAVKADYGNASILADNRVCFIIGGNKYRLIVHINYPYRLVLIKFIGTHEEYDMIDANTV